MNTPSNRIAKSLVVYVLWLVATLYGGKIISGGEETPLDEMVTSGIGWQFVAAVAVLLIAIVIFRWNDLRFTLPRSVFRTMWFPLIYLVVFAVAVIALGAPPAVTFSLILMNTMLVGFSEEVMFRGVLFRAFEDRMAIWPAILLTSALFGAVHVLNAFITGDLFAASVQALAAGLSGLVFMAILLRTGSIWPAIIYHGLWDCMLFMIVTATKGAADPNAAVATTDPPSWAVFIPLVLNLPNVIFALILLRNIGQTHRLPSNTVGALRRS